MKQKQFLTIGDVSKIMNVHIKSLRYYDKIGILKPAYTDLETNYRYYLPSQLGVVQAIQFCVEIGIPLKRFSAFYAGNKISTLRLLEEAQELAVQKIQTIQTGLSLMEELHGTIQKNDLLEKNNQAMEYDLDEKRYMVEEVKRQYGGEPETEMELNRILSRLQMEALRRGLKTGLSYGYLYIYRGKEILQRYVYAEVYGNNMAEQEDILAFPAMTCKAVCVTETSIETAPEIFPEEFQEHIDTAVFETEIVSGVFNTQKPKYELRCCAIV